MKHTTGLIIGIVLFALGVQGGIRLLADHGDAGILGWTPGGFAVRLSGYALMVLIGVVLAGWGSKKAKQSGRGR